MLFLPVELQIYELSKFLVFQLCVRSIIWTSFQNINFRQHILLFGLFGTSQQFVIVHLKCCNRVHSNNDNSQSLHSWTRSQMQLTVWLFTWALEHCLQPFDNSVWIWNARDKTDFFVSPIKRLSVKGKVLARFHLFIRTLILNVSHKWLLFLVSDTLCADDITVEHLTF